MARQMMKSLTDGATVDEVFVALDKQLRANRNGNSYLQMELRDRSGSIAARQWNANESAFRAFEEGDFL
ncbi:MAG: CMP-binding protein, partial [Planctomycetes bacterium]|nr:CMP-binding protein [Planctomycetota bacterium]